MERITDKYYLGSNKNTFILYERKISAAGKETFKNVGYISSLETVYSKLIEKEVREDISIMKDINRLNNIVNELKEFTVKYVNEHLSK